VNVVCDGHSADPRKYFPDPANVYGVTNANCSGTGTRAFDGIDSGCFDIQIQGCGVRQIAGLTATSISFSGGACTWSNGAQVGVPWAGAAQDVGPLEFLPAPQLISVEQSG
jgi:hypothetical protein